MRAASFKGICLAVLTAACTGQREPARLAISDIDAVVHAAAPQAASYAPRELTRAQTELGALKAAYARDDYAAVLAGAAAAMHTARLMSAAATSEQQHAVEALNEQWASLARTVPDALMDVDRRLAQPASPGAKRSAGNVSAARTGLVQAAAMWSKAQAAFAAGNLPEAVATARRAQNMLPRVVGGQPVGVSARASPR